jgi:hypothetical protein
VDGLVVVGVATMVTFYCFFAHFNIRFHSHLDFAMPMAPQGASMSMAPEADGIQIISNFKHIPYNNRKHFDKHGLHI